MLLAKQCVFLGPPSPLSVALSRHVDKLAIRLLESDVPARADSLLRTVRRLVLVVIDARDAAIAPELVDVATKENPRAAVFWLAPKTGEVPSFAGQVVTVLRLDADDRGDELLRAIDIALKTAMFPDILSEVIINATSMTFAEQYGVRFLRKETWLRGDAESLGEIGVGVSLTSTRLIGYLGLFCGRSFIERMHVSALQVEAKGDEIAHELMNLIAGRLRSLLLNSIGDLRFRLPSRWESIVSVRNAAPALVVAFEHGGERVHIDFRTALFDGDGLTTDSTKGVLAPGSMSFFS